MVPGAVNASETTASDDAGGSEVLITGPHRVEEPHPGLVDSLTDLWRRVTDAGGAVGFRPTDPVDDVRAAAAEVVDDVTNKRARLLTIGQEHVLAGVAVLTPGKRPAQRHTGQLTWLMVDPSLQRQGWGRTLHEAVLVQGQALGLEKLELITRSGHDLERFYEGLGWVERGRWPGALRLADDDVRDKIWFTRDL